ncbi:DMT family transporter [Winogradskyella aurantiaca]|uniref:DMT family transporter n=1 Tax=Winogradskyella aurantiaca TaxID=2219558 RepID=UPI000E1D4AFA|nr:DMT family transporter [Winogradskyella aurantiaca]
MSRKTALVALVTVQLLYGLNYTFAKTVINDGYVGAFGFVVLRVVGALILFWLLSLFLPKEKIDKRDYLRFIVAAIFGVFINMLLFLKGLELTSPIHASSIMTITPVIILILSYFILNEALTKRKIFGVFLAFAGALVLTIYGKSVRAADNVFLGNTFIFINAVSYSIYVILIKQLTTKYHPLTFIKWLFLFGAFMVFPFGYEELTEIKLNTYTNYAYFSIAFVVLGATFGTYLLNPLALSKLKASTVGAFVYLQPAIAGIFAIVMGVDQMDTVKMLAMLIIFTGVFLASKKPKATA